tara:strand:+ start:177 stop:821 length:645 start_codon:yes stop_codon:yes gene_type:complete
MKKYINVFVATLFLTAITTAKSEISIGFGLIGGQTEISGTETEGTAADTSTRSKTIKEQFVGGDIFIESISDSGLTFGLSYVPLDIELGSGSRTDTSTGADVASEADTGTRKASADLEDLFTLYTNVPLGTNGYYGLLGVHMTTVSTSETLNASSYGNEDIFGAQVGLGFRSGNFKTEFSYSDFEDINLSSSGGGTNSIAADADALTLRISIGF